mmetsp:Transcript_9526/g.14021  ORF Transcript_9526/g.14021 Transcript_9526/m.14021 type:complete len:338 (+) Transcript_9526:67-1080(+)
MRFAALILVALTSVNVYVEVDAFAPTSNVKPQIRIRTNSKETVNPSIDPSANVGKINQYTTLQMAAQGKKKRRRRKKNPAEPDDVAGAAVPESAMPVEGSKASDDLPSIEELKAIADFAASGTPSGSAASPAYVSPLAGNMEQSDSLVEMPNIRDVLRNKEIKKIEEEEKEQRARPKISRKDRKAMLQLLEEQPYADADASYFEDEAYGTVSALLAEGAESFLGIPPGPLQVGHFIGALVIVLMAFVEYPGFPLTNLPTPLRDCLQGGLATVYLVNTILAVLATFKASERGQSSVLWAAKTFSVGGLAFDQLTQLPTLKEVEELENRKGARAIKKSK